MAQGFLSSDRSPLWWHVVFLGRDAERWWDRLSPRWCRHVLCYGWSEAGDRWLVVDPMVCRTSVEVLDDEGFDQRALDWRDAVIVRVKRRDGVDARAALAQTCSSIVARVIGLSGSAWRPMALVRRLRAEAAEIVRDPAHVYWPQSSDCQR